MTPQELSAWRKERSLTQRVLAEALQAVGARTVNGHSVYQNTVAQWEAGRAQIPDDLHIFLHKADERLDTATEAQTDVITAAAFPHLFQYSRDHQAFLPTDLHPNMLARRGLFGWTGCIWHIAHTNGCIPCHPLLLQTNQYRAACAMRQQKATHPGVQARREWFLRHAAPDGVTIVPIPHPESRVWPLLERTEAVEPWFGYNFVHLEGTWPDWFPDSFVMKPWLPAGHYWGQGDNDGGLRFRPEGN